MKQAAPPSPRSNFRSRKPPTSQPIKRHTPKSELPLQATGLYLYSICFSDEASNRV